MKRALEFLSHPAWAGFGAISGGVGHLLMAAIIYLMIYPPTPQPGQAVNSRQGSSAAQAAGSGRSPAGDPGGTDDVRPAATADAQADVNKTLNDSLGFIGPDYHGRRQYFNDEWPVGVLAVACLTVGVGALVLHRRAKAADKRCA